MPRRQLTCSHCALCGWGPRVCWSVRLLFLSCLAGAASKMWDSSVSWLRQQAHKLTKPPVSMLRMCHRYKEGYDKYGFDVNGFNKQGGKSAAAAAVTDNQISPGVLFPTIQSWPYVPDWAQTSGKSQQLTASEAVAVHCCS